MVKSTPIASPKAVHLTSVHPPFDTRIFHKQCRTLADAGYEVVLIAPHGQDEMLHGVQIRGLRPARNRFERMLLTTVRLFTKALKEKGSVYHFHDPELIPVGIALRVLGKRVVYDVHEDVPKDILGKQWIPRPLRKVLAVVAGFMEAIGAFAFHAIVAATPSIAERFPSSKTVQVQNFPVVGELVSDRPTPYESRPPWVAYVGGIAENRGIREMVKAMSQLDLRKQGRLRLAGLFMSGDLEREVKATPGWTNVDFLGWRSRNELADLLGNSRVGLVLFHPEPNHVEAQPNKLFEYMSAGIPVVASDFPLWRDIVDGAGCGLLVDPLDPNAIASAIKYLLTHPGEANAMGERGRRAVQERYNWGAEAAKLLDLYAGLLCQ